jgi:hypothetical protein
VPPTILTLRPFNVILNMLLPLVLEIRTISWVSMYFSSIDTTLAKVVLNTYKKSLVVPFFLKESIQRFLDIYLRSIGLTAFVNGASS